MDEVLIANRAHVVELGQDYARLKRSMRNLNVLGGCCGTDDRHVCEIAAACAPLFGLDRKSGKQ